MVRHVDAIFSQGALRPLEPLALPEGTRVHLSVEEYTSASTLPPAAKVDGRRRDESWATLQRLWNSSTFNSAGDRLTREQLHERR